MKAIVSLERASRDDRMEGKVRIGICKRVTAFHTKRVLASPFLPIAVVILVLGCSGDNRVCPDISPGPTPGAMVLVPAGIFTMGEGVAFCGESQHQVTLTHSFYLGKYEVTNQEYRDALQWAYTENPPLVVVFPSGVYDNTDGSRVELVNFESDSCCISFRADTFAVRSGKENYPMVEVSWYGAAAYCDWLSMMQGLTRAYSHSTWQCNGGSPYTAQGYRLPTDAEWEYAARYNDGRIYPWGNETPDCSRANTHGCVGRTTPVGSYPAAPASLGLCDMVGNVWEWCNDWWTCDLGMEATTDPTGLSNGSRRTLRGGSWRNDGDNLRCALRLGSPLSGGYVMGFRIVRSQ